MTAHPATDRETLLESYLEVRRATEGLCPPLALSRISAAREALRMLLISGAQIVNRCPIVRGVNDNPQASPLRDVPQDP